MACERVFVHARDIGVHILSRATARECRSGSVSFGRGDDTVGNPHRAQIYEFELSELILSLELDKQFPVEQFEATVSQSTVPSPPLTRPYSQFASQDLRPSWPNPWKILGHIVYTLGSIAA